MDAVALERRHSHDQNEMYFILEGEGTLHTKTGKKHVIKGDAIFLPGGKEHHITNSGMGILSLFMFLIRILLAMLNTLDIARSYPQILEVHP